MSAAYITGQVINVDGGRTRSSIGYNVEISNNVQKLFKRLTGNVGKAIADYNMIEQGDTVLVCVSGGKDSFTLLSILMAMQERAPIDFKLVAMNLDQKQPGFPEHILPAISSRSASTPHCRSRYLLGGEGKDSRGQDDLLVCSRLRRGIIYRTAKELGANKIALGHHRDDMGNTLFLNLLFGGKIKAMPPKLITDDGAHVVIRPLAYCAEADIARYARAVEYPIIPCNLCGSQENMQRKKIREMMQDWDRRYPGRTEAVFLALQNVVPLASGRQQAVRFPWAATGRCRRGGDTAFDGPQFGEELSLPEPFPVPLKTA